MQKKNWKITLGRQIKAARELRQLSQEKLGERAHSNRGSIYLYEKGKGNPEFKVVAEIAALLQAEFKVLGCRIAAEELLERPRAKPPEQLELAFDQNHSFLANVIIRPTKKSITITAHAEYGIKTG